MHQSVWFIYYVNFQHDYDRFIYQCINRTQQPYSFVLHLYLLPREKILSTPKLLGFNIINVFQIHKILIKILKWISILKLRLRFCISAICILNIEKSLNN